MAEQNIDMAVLPEMFNCPYKLQPPVRREGGECYGMLICKYIWNLPYSRTVPEKDEERIFNTCYVFDRKEINSKAQKNAPV